MDTEESKISIWDATVLTGRYWASIYCKDLQDILLRRTLTPRCCGKLETNMGTQLTQYSTFSLDGGAVRDTWVALREKSVLPNYFYSHDRIRRPSRFSAVTDVNCTKGTPSE